MKTGIKTEMMPFKSQLCTSKIGIILDNFNLAGGQGRFFFSFVQDYEMVGIFIRV